MGINTDIGSYVNAWFAQNQNRNKSLLAKLTKIPSTTLRRILQSETEPSFEHTMAIVGIVCTKEQAISIIQKYWPGEARFLKEQAAKYEVSSNELQDFLVSSREHWAIILMASTDIGTTREDLIKRLGISAEEPLDEMLDSDILVQRDGRIFATQRDFSIFNISIMMRQLSIAVEMFPRNNVGKFGFAGFFSEGLNLEAAAKAVNIIKDCQLQLQALNAPENKGEVVIYAGMFINKL